MTTSSLPGRLQAGAALLICALAGLSQPAWSAEFAAKQRVAPLPAVQPVATGLQADTKVRVAASAVQADAVPAAVAPATPEASTSLAALQPLQQNPHLPPAPTPIADTDAHIDPLPSATPASALAVSPAPSVRVAVTEPPPRLNSSVALVMDQDTHQVLLRKNDTAVVPIASLTKMMTGLVVADARLNMNERIRITSADVDRLKNSGSRLAVGARLTRGEALHLALMSSENRAAHALARTFPGGEERFVRLMNAKAKELGMDDTRFVDPTGLSSLNRSSARDLARLAAAAAERPLLRDLSTSPSYEVALGRRVVQYRNSNRLVMRDDWDINLQKTGYIREAGRCLLMQVNVAGRQLIMVLLDAAGPAARLGDAERVRRWAESLMEDVGDSHASPLAVKRRPSV